MSNTRADIKSLSTLAARKVCEKFHVYPEAVEIEDARRAILTVRLRANECFQIWFPPGSAKTGNFHT
jgi:hypothetical protein